MVQKGKKKGDDLSTEDVPLQALLLADSFETSLRPVSLELPKALFPLAGVPMIEYSLQFLCEAGVKEVFVFCGWLADKVKE